MKKIKVIGVLFIFIFFFSLSSCSVNTITKISDEVEYTKIENDITKTYDNVKNGCIGIITKDDKGAYSGSGVIYKYDDTTKIYYVVTNHHVVAQMKEVYIYFGNNIYNKANILGSDETNDIAVVTFTLDAFNTSLASKINVIDIFNYDDNDYIAVGQTVLAIGCPLSTSNYNYLTTGVVSKTTNQELAVNCELNPGNSGGGLFNLAGRLIGIVYSKKSYVPHGATTIPAEGMGNAVPINIVKKAISDIEYNKTVIVRPVLGITVATVNSVLNSNMDEFEGVIPDDGKYVHFVVSDFTEDSKAKKSGMLVNDVILRINDEEILSSEDIRYVLNMMYGGTVIIEVYRIVDNNPTTLSITINF